MHPKVNVNCFNHPTCFPHFPLPDSGSILVRISDFPIPIFPQAYQFESEHHTYNISTIWLFGDEDYLDEFHDTEKE